jgi:hypothetical protein
LALIDEPVHDPADILVTAEKRTGLTLSEGGKPGIGVGDHSDR